MQRSRPASSVLLEAASEESRSLKVLLTATAEANGQPLISQSGTGPVSVGSERCGSCSGTGKVMCIACLCTGKCPACVSSFNVSLWEAYAMRPG